MKIKNFFAHLLTLAILFMAASFVNSAEAQTWSDSGTVHYSDKGIKSFTFSGTLSGTSDTMYTNTFTAEDYPDNISVYVYAEQANDSISLKVERHAFIKTDLWKSVKSVGTDTVTAPIIWADSLAENATSYRVAIFGSSAAGGDENGFQTKFWGKVVFRDK